jgi:hypothetical protein
VFWLYVNTFKYFSTTTATTTASKEEMREKERNDQNFLGGFDDLLGMIP